jgi:prepilin-type N-terminal cleavage/methylation domain-containing protein
MKKGFTLIELLVVISIISILTAIALPNIEKVRARSRDSTRIADISQTRLALEHYFNRYNKYPVNINVANATEDASVNGSNSQFLKTGILSVVPKDPKTKNNYFYASYCAGAGNPSGYHLGAQFELQHEQLNADSDIGPLSLGVCSTMTDFSGSDTTGCGGGMCYDFAQ